MDNVGETHNTIVIFTTDNGAEVFTWPDGGMTPFAAALALSAQGGRSLEHRQRAASAGALAGDLRA